MTQVLLQKIESLSDDQAQRALLAFYDLLPESLWASGKKPSGERVENLVDRMEENISDDVATFVEKVRSQNDNRRAAVSRAILMSFNQNNDFQPYIEKATAQAMEPHMSPLPLYIAEFMIIMAALSVEIGKTKDGWYFRGKAPELVGKLTGFVKALPQSIWGWRMLGNHRYVFLCPTGLPTPRSLQQTQCNLRRQAPTGE